MAEADKAEQVMALAGSVRVNNNSGEDYENAQVRLVVGVIRLVEEIAQLARVGRPGGLSLQPHNKEPRGQIGGILNGPCSYVIDRLESKPREIVKEGISEFFLYTVEGRDTIPTGWSKRMPSFKARDVKIVSYYKYERERWGVQVIRYYRFKNDKESKLGDEPLPDGAVMAFRTVTPDNLYAFVGRTNVKYIPIGEAVELELGNDQEVMVKPRLMNWEKLDLRFSTHGDVVGWTTRETWQVEVQNSKDIDIVLDIRRNFAGDWDLKTDKRYEKVDATKAKFVLPLEPREKQTFTYELTTRYGVNAAR